MSWLLANALKQTKEPVVVVIDEYDAVPRQHSDVHEGSV